MRNPLLNYSFWGYEVNDSRLKERIQEGNNVNETNIHNDNPLLYCLRTSRHTKYLKLLINAGADINFKNKACYSFLYKAIQDDKPISIIRLLIKAGCDLYPTDLKGKPISLLHCAVIRYDTDIQIIKELLNKGIDINIKNQNGETPIQYLIGHYSSVKRYEEVLKFLLKNGANINIVDNLGDNALTNKHNSVWSEQIEFLFKNTSLNINHQNREGNTALHDTCSNEISSLLLSLLKHNPDVNIQNKKGLIPLHLLAQKKKYYFKEYEFEKLLEHGANPKLKDNSGKTALDYLKGHETIQLYENLKTLTCTT